ncbi:MAG TPA: S-layer homology domain-containing protein, partial [Capsulimonadaceae bacterium]|nr:S-layer homology domain-containing protein [Capsulimonadaceae bacterium]
MTKFLTLCAGAAMLLSTTLGVAGQAKAQDQTAPATGAASGPFADVPADHWAYQAVDTLQKAGIVIGYPDGTYGGRRAMTRYEFAVAIARLLPLINANAASKSDLAALQQDLESKLEANQQALDALKSLVDEFQPELQQLGQDVAAVKARLDALEQRLAVVEAEQRRVKVNGDVNFIARGLVNTSSIDTAALDKDGYR